MIGAGLAAGPCPAATIRVPEDSPSVLAAVDLAMPGDSVLVGPGTWTETATRVVVARTGSFLYKACAFARGGVVIRGQGPDLTTLDVGGSTGPFAAVILLVERTGEGALRVESMTLTGAGGVGGGTAVEAVFADGVEVRSCRIEGNESSSGAAANVYQCPLTMVDCEIVGNTSAGGALRIDAPVFLSGCRFEGNIGRCLQTNYDSGSFIPAVIRDCEFIRNRGTSSVCLNLQHAGGFVVERCLFLENVSETGSGAGIRTTGSSGEIRFNVFAYDSCYASSSVGGGVLLEGGSVQTMHNSFVSCYAGLNGAAFASAFGASGGFANNVVCHTTRPAVRFASGTTTTSGCNLFWSNSAGDFGGGGAPSPTDFVADPLFCDFAARDFTVRNDSPCLFPPTPSCGPIGALGVGCGGVAIEPTSWGRLKAAYRGGSP